VRWTGSVNGSFDRGARTITTTTDTGLLNNIRPDSTIRVTDSAGNPKDYPSKVRYRSFSVNDITIGDNNIEWADGDLLSAELLFEIWPKHVFVDQTTEEQYKDRDIAWSSDAETQNPKANTGPAAIGKLVGGQCDLTFTDNNSYNPPLGGAPASYQWIAWTGTPAVVGGAENTTTVTYRWTAAGYYIVSLEVDDGAGNTGIMYVCVIVDDGTLGREVSNIDYRGDKTGWTLNLSNLGLDYDDSYFYDGAPLFLVAEENDFTATNAFADYRHNLRWSGWLIEDRTQINADSRRLTYKAVSSAHVMRTIPAYSAHIGELAVPTSWYEMTNVNIDSIVHHILEWHSTVNACCDVQPTGEWNNRQRPGEEPDLDDLLTEVDYILSGCVGSMRCDRQGILRSMRKEWYLSVAERAARATVMTLTNSDFQNIRYGPAPHRASVKQVRGDGVGGDETPYYSGSPGDAPLDGGRPEELKKLSPNSQNECNQWTAAHLSVRNWSIPLILTMSGEYDCVDPAYGEFVAGTLLNYDGRLANGPYSIEGVRMRVNQRDSIATSEWELLPDPAAYGAYGAQAITIPTEPPPPEDDDIPIIDYPDPDPIPVGEWPEEVYVFVSDATDGGVYYTDDFTGTDAAAQPTWTDVSSGLASRVLLVGAIDAADPQNHQYCLAGAAGSRVFYHRENEGTWSNESSSLTEAQIRDNTPHAFFISTDAQFFDMHEDPVTSTLWVAACDIGAVSATYAVTLFKSTNHGVSWTRVDVLTTNAYTSMVPAGPTYHWLDCYNDDLFVGASATTGVGFRDRIEYSTNGGTTWFTSDTSGTTIFKARCHANPNNYQTYVYRRMFPSVPIGHNMNWYQIGVQTYSLTSTQVWDGTEADPAYWAHPSDVNVQRTLNDDAPNSTELVYTLNNWSSFFTTTLYPDGSQTTQVQQIYGANDVDTDMIIYGTKDVNQLDNPHCILVGYGTSYNEPDGKAGNSPQTSPYADSIPWTAELVRKGIHPIKIS
jgi:hypothetical protein